MGPDFIITGAMKSGTTSLYTILRQHPDVYMPDLEVGFYDVDDIRQHPDFFKRHGGRWNYHRFGVRDETLREWYESLFENAEAGQVTGERSTTYMPSAAAPERISETNPDARLLFMMRDPVPRAYSNYWHLLRSGEATASFEKTLRYRPAVLFERGLYRQHLERYLRYFGRGQMLFIVFEEYLDDPRKVLDEACRFIGVDPEGMPERAEERHENRGRYPWLTSVQYGCNLILFHGLLDGHRYLDSHLPALTFDELGYSLFERARHRLTEFGFKAISRLNCSRRARPEMRGETKELLKYLYESRNAGLSSMIDKDLSRWWSVTDV